MSGQKSEHKSIGPQREQEGEAALPHQESPVADAKVQELTELLQRTQANFENYRKQIEKRMEEMQSLAAKEIIFKLLPLIDHFQLALQNTGHQQEFVKGVELVYAELTGVLEEEGVAPLETVGQRFDPYYHEALIRVESEKPENSIIEEFQRGFTLHGQVLRHAKVKVSAGKQNHPKTKEQALGKTEETKNGK